MPKAATVRTETIEDLSPIERRGSERADLVVRVDYLNVDDLFSEFARNINEGGIFVETETPPKRGARVDLQFRLPGSDQPVRALGTVVRVTEGDSDDPPGMGIEFDDLDADTRERINELVRRLRASG
jgi:type IV pilus assembly protein PilZ